MKWTLTIVFVLSTSVGPGPLHARIQAPTVVPSDMCSDCRLQIDTLFEVGGVDHPAFPGPPGASGVVDSRGYRYFVFFPVLSEISVLNTAGEHVHTIGRSGGGPGEFTRIQFVQIGKGDSLYVTDTRGARISVFSPDWSFVRSFPIPLGDVRGVAFLNDERLVIAAHVFDSDLVGLPLHLLSTHDGRLLDSFGNPEEIMRPDMGNSMRRLIAVGVGERVWSAKFMEYVLEEFDSNGRRTRLLVRSARDWFPPSWAGVWPIGPDTPPNPTIRNIYVDAGGLIWVNVAVPEPDFENAFPPGYRAGDEAPIRSDLLYGTRLEVIDPSGGQLLASYYTDDFLTLLTDGSVTRYVEDRDGIPALTVERFTLRRGVR